MKEYEHTCTKYKLIYRNHPTRLRRTHRHDVTYNRSRVFCEGLARGVSPNSAYLLPAPQRLLAYAHKIAYRTPSKM